MTRKSLACIIGRLSVVLVAGLLAALLLSAIESVAQAADGTLRVDRAALRAELAATDGFQGLIGAITCDAFGDCGNGITNVYRHTDSDATDVAELEVFHQFVP